MRIARKIDETWGRDRARTFIGFVGTFLMLLGLYILVAPLVATTMLQPTDVDQGPKDQSIGAWNLAEVD
jgi:hypothetical protein